MKIFSITFFLIINFLSLPMANAADVSPIDLQQLSTRASLIFYGKVIANEVKKDQQSGLIATFTEFQIIDLIKGEAENIHTIKQVGGRSLESNRVVKIPGVPQFVTGKNYVVFLPKKSRLGFSSPLGLQQGSFDVLTINGEQVVSNVQRVTSTTHSSSSVQIPLAVSIEKPSTARLDDFINTVRAYNTD